MTLSTFTLSHLPDNPIHIIAFKDVTNARSLRDELLKGNEDFEYAFIDGRMIVSPKTLLASVFRAINDWRANRLRSRNVHSEVVFCMNSINNIAESFRRFGLADDTTSMVAIKVCTRASTTSPPSTTATATAAEAQAVNQEGLSSKQQSADETEQRSRLGSDEISPSAMDVYNHLTSAVDGTPLPSWDQICAFADLDRVRKVHKLPPPISPQAPDGVDPGVVAQQERDDVEAALLGMIAIRGG